MDFTPDQNVKSNDFKAHIQKLKEELRSVSVELDATMRQKETASKELDALSRNIAIENTKLESILKLHKEKLDEIAIAEKSISERESDLAKSINEFESRKGTEETRIAELIRNGELSITRLNLELLDIQKKLDDKNKLLSNTNTSIIKYQKLIKDLESSQRKIEARISSLTDEYVEQDRILTSKILDKQKELNKLTDKIEEEKEKIKLPLITLQEQQEQFNRELKNLEIRKMRLSKYLAKYFPNEVLKV